MQKLSESKFGEYSLEKDRVYSYTARKAADTPIHEISHKILDQTAGKDISNWKEELFAFSFGYMVGYERKLHRKTNLIEQYTSKGKISRKEAVNKEFREHMQQRIYPLITNQKVIKHFPEHIAALKMFKRILEKNNYNIEKSMQQVRDIVYNKKIFLQDYLDLKKYSIHY